MTRQKWCIVQLTGAEAAGGLVGRVGPGATAGAAIELQSDINISIGKISTDNSSDPKGQAVGKQEVSLVYFGAGTTAWNSTQASINEIGTYGGIYRNQNMGSNWLIGTRELADVGKINNTVNNYQLTSKADFITLAIALNTNGNYGKEAFNQATYETLLSATYTVTNTVDISYNNTGIVTLNRNDSASTNDDAFCGIMQGPSQGVTITQNNSVEQSNVGIFSKIGGNATFSNLTFEGKIQNANGAGGIAYQSVGTGITLTNVTMAREFENNTGYIGGVLAKEAGSSLFTVTATNVTLASEMNAGSLDDCSGFITEMGNATVNMQDIKLGGEISGSNNVEMGGFLGKTWTATGGTISTITVPNGATYTTTGSAALNDPPKMVHRSTQITDEFTGSQNPQRTHQRLGVSIKPLQSHNIICSVWFNRYRHQEKIHHRRMGN